MNHLLLTRDALNIAAIIDIVSDDSCGASSLFIGTTRNSFEEKKVLSLEYEAYEPMALKQMESICEDLRQMWPDISNIVIYHRLGLVPVREVGVVIAVSSPHRKTSLDAVASAVEELKKRVPIWKKEKYEDNECSWKENNESNVYWFNKSVPFDERMCDIDGTCSVPNQLVQISACEDEIKRRIECFVEKKRDEIDLCNIMDYTEKGDKQYYEKELQLHVKKGLSHEIDNESMKCARINSTIVKQEFSKCHVKVRRVENNVGPQMRPDYFNTLDKLMTFKEKQYMQTNSTMTKVEIDKEGAPEVYSTEILKHPAIIERLENIEKYINVSPSKIRNIYKRLKIIEDRILFLESISPEYSHFLKRIFNIGDPTIGFQTSKNNTATTEFSSFEHKIYTAEDISSIIKGIENQNYLIYK